MKFKIVLDISNRSIWHQDEAFTDITILNQSGTGSNDNKEVTLHSPGLKDWSLFTGGSLVSYTAHQN